MQKLNSTPPRQGQDQLVPFLWIRRSIGVFGFILPPALVFGALLFGKCKTVLGSISDYYHSNMVDIFIGVICVLAFFLFTYKGPEKKDNISSNLAGIFALGVVFFPTSLKPNSSCTLCKLETFETTHGIFAALFFIAISYMSIALFTKSEDGITPSPQKIKRNQLYKTCGYIMLACIAIIAIYFILEMKNIVQTDLPIIFIFEWVALWAFGLSWITKGGWLLEDKKNN